MVSSRVRQTECCRRSKRPPGVAEIAAVLVAARDEESNIGQTVESLHDAFPGTEVIVADDGSRDGTAAEAERAGARVLSLPARGKGQALTLAEHAAPAGRLLLVDADLEGDLAKLAAADGDLAIAAFAERQSGGFGIAKRAGRTLVRVLSGFAPQEPLSGQRALSKAARDACFPLAAGFGCEVRMTIDAVKGGLRVSEVELPLRHRATGRDAAGFAHRARQLLDAVLACGPSGVNHRGLRLPLVGGVVVMLAPYDLREMTMLGDAGANALGAMLGLNSVGKLTGRGRWSAIGVLAGLTLLGETRSLGELIERTPVLREFDALGRQP